MRIGAHKASRAVSGPLAWSSENGRVRGGNARASLAVATVAVVTAAVSTAVTTASSDAATPKVARLASGISSSHHLALDTSTLEYGVSSLSAQQSAPAGLSAAGDPDGSLTFDPLHPGVAVFGSFDGTGSALLFADSPGSVLAVRRDRDAYAADHGRGALIVHFHNVVGDKAQPVAFEST